MATSSAYPPPPPYFRLYKDKEQDPSSAREPPPPIDGPYQLFGATYTTNVMLPSLEDQGVCQLYPNGPNVGVYFPWKLIARRVEDISLVFKNLHHLLNSLRPHQARATLIHMLESQIKSRKEAVEDIKQKEGRGGAKAAQGITACLGWKPD